jgi:hypothetical protein
LSFQFTAPAEAREKAHTLTQLAALQLASGDRIGAVDFSREALKLDVNCFAAYELLARIALIGEDYRGLLQRIHAHLRPRTYVEIGVAQGATIRLAGAQTLAIGIDPAPDLQGELPKNIQVAQATSDEFFARSDVRDQLGGNAIDLAFIDGMHLFEFALRDFINIERHATPASVVLLHDCYPLNEVTAARQRVTTFWTGDIWKLVLCLKKYRPDLRVNTLACPPSGIAVIRGLDPNNRVLRSQLDAVCREFIALPYGALGPDKRAALNLVPGDWETTRALLR